MDPHDLSDQIAAQLNTLPEQTTAPMRKVRRHWSSTLRKEPAEDVLALALDLFERHSYRWIAYELILFHPTALKLIDAATLEHFGSGMSSWSNVDQFGALLAGPAWRAGQIEDSVIHAWAHRPDRWWRRAALVATVPLNNRSQGGKGDVPRTFAICQLLVRDRDDMVVKAMSWALRQLTVHDGAAVEQFLATHDDVLAARVKREVRNKLRTGLKNPDSRRQQPC
jgi:3-methyladenine DNA glycosylase AlkD